MKIKMCGIKTPADVAAVNEVRPDYIGMVMYFPKSKRMSVWILRADYLKN